MNPAALASQRCFHHSLREAVARCPECGHFYCRECITEHDDRVICAACLRQLAATEPAQRMSLAWAWPGLQLAAGLIMLWLCFYLFGAALLSIPTSYHEGSVWTEKWWNTE